MQLLLGFSFFMGVVTVLSPCILPVLPVFLSMSATRAEKCVLRMIFGFLIGFIFFAMSFAKLEKSFGVTMNILRDSAMILILLFGIMLLFPSLNFQKKKGFLSSVAIGFILGFIWTPYAGPILAAIISLIAIEEMSSQVILLILAYLFGVFFPLLLLTFGWKYALNFSFFAKNFRRIQQGFGALMILMAVAIALDWDSLFHPFILD